eukprot:251152-Chlamydomonas_euryale.AAC.12
MQKRERHWKGKCQKGRKRGQGAQPNLQTRAASTTRSVASPRPIICLSPPAKHRSAAKGRP